MIQCSLKSKCVLIFNIKRKVWYVPKAPKDALWPSENGQKVGPLQGPVASDDFQNLRKTLQIILSRMKFSTK